MPRRRKTPGFPSRVDVAAPVPAQDTQPVRVPGGLPYGQAGRLEDAQRALPLAAVPEPAPSDVLAAATQMAPPQALLARPTTRPAEPVTAGAPVGPGPGREALGARPRVSDILAEIAAELDDDPNLMLLAQRARNLGR